MDIRAGAVIFTTIKYYIHQSVDFRLMIREDLPSISPPRLSCLRGSDDRSSRRKVMKNGAARRSGSGSEALNNRSKVPLLIIL